MDFLGWSVNILLVLLGSAALFAMSIVSFVIIVFLYYCFGFSSAGVRMDWHAVFCVYSGLLYILNVKHSNRATKVHS